MPSVWSWAFPALGSARALQVINAGAIIGCYQFAGAAPHPVDLSGLMENIWKLSFPKQKRCWDCELEQVFFFSSHFSVSFSLPISPSPHWTGFKKENSKPCLKAICGRRWAQLWSWFFTCGGSQTCCRILCVPIFLCVCIKTSLCCRWGGREGIWGLSAWSVMWVFFFYSPHSRPWKQRHFTNGSEKCFSSLLQEQVVPRGERLEAKMGKCVTQSCGLHGSSAHVQQGKFTLKTYLFSLTLPPLF